MDQMCICVLIAIHYINNLPWRGVRHTPIYRCTDVTHLEHSSLLCFFGKILVRFSLRVFEARLYPSYEFLGLQHWACILSCGSGLNWNQQARECSVPLWYSCFSVYLPRPVIIVTPDSSADDTSLPVAFGHYKCYPWAHRDPVSSKLKDKDEDKDVYLGEAISLARVLRQLEGGDSKYG